MYEGISLGAMDEREGCCVVLVSGRLECQYSFRFRLRAKPASRLDNVAGQAVQMEGPEVRRNETFIHESFSRHII